MSTDVFYASGSKGPEVRADGNGEYLERGFYFKKPGFALGVVLAGPFRTKSQAMECLLREMNMSCTG